MRYYIAAYAAKIRQGQELSKKTGTAPVLPLKQPKIIDVIYTYWYNITIYD